MFIVAKKRRLRRPDSAGVAPVMLDFQLVRAVKVNGKPRQKFICALGSVPDLAEVSHFCAEKLYRKMIPRLKAHGFPITPENLKTVTRRVPMPTEESSKKARADEARALGLDKADS